MGERLTAKLIEELIDLEGDDNWILYDEIEGDALNRLAEHDGSPWVLETQLQGHSVEIHSDKTIIIDGHRSDRGEQCSNHDESRASSKQ